MSFSSIQACKFCGDVTDVSTTSKLPLAMNSASIHTLRYQGMQDYVLHRLVKGTGSGRMAARQGFATALTAFLTAQPDLKLSVVSQLMEELLAYSGSMKASVRI